MIRWKLNFDFSTDYACPIEASIDFSFKSIIKGSEKDIGQAEDDMIV